MNYIDQCANNSKLNYISSRAKILFGFLTICVCMVCNNIVVSVTVFLFVGFLIMGVGGTKFRIYIKLLLIPVSFLVISCVAMALRFTLSDIGDPYIRIFGVYISSNKEAAIQAFFVLVKTMACFSSLFFISLTTPAFEFVACLQKLHLPGFLAELMLLIYRFIFILLDAYMSMYTAQQSRLGYSTLKASYRSFAAIASSLFLKAFKKADALYTAMEARLYDGHLNVLELDQKERWYYYAGILLFEALLIGITILI